MEAIHKQKAEKQREKAIADQFEARRAKNKSSRARKLERRETRLAGVSIASCEFFPYWYLQPPFEKDVLDSS